MLYSIVLVSAKYQHEWAIGIHMSPPSWTSLSPLFPSHLYNFNHLFYIHFLWILTITLFYSQLIDHDERRSDLLKVTQLGRREDLLGLTIGPVYYPTRSAPGYFSPECLYVFWLLCSPRQSISHWGHKFLLCLLLFW